MSWLGDIDARIGAVLEGGARPARLDLGLVQAKVEKEAFAHITDGPSGRELPLRIFVRISIADWRRLRRERLTTHAAAMKHALVESAGLRGIGESAPYGLQIAYVCDADLVPGEARPVAEVTWPEAIGLADTTTVVGQTGNATSVLHRSSSGLLQAVANLATVVGRRALGFVGRIVLAVVVSAPLTTIGAAAWASIDPPGLLWVEALFVTHTGRLALPDLRQSLVPAEIVQWWRDCRMDARCIEAGVREAPEAVVRDMRAHYRSSLGREACDAEVDAWLIEAARYRLSRHQVIQKIDRSEEATAYASTSRARTVPCDKGGPGR